MAIRVAINGFGRVGRYLVKACQGYDEVDIVAINSRAKPDNLAHLLKYDSVHGKFGADVAVEDGHLVVNGKKILVTTVSSPLADLPWKKLDIHIVLDSTGKFRKKDDLTGHLAAGAKKVILAVPGKGIDGTFVMGVNEETYDPQRHHIISNASCTTNCLAPVAKVLHDEFTIVKGLITTVHSYTMDQRLLDGSHKDYRRGRAAAMSIVPTSTGAAKAVAEVIPALKGKLDGVALRVPTPNVSIVDLAAAVGTPEIGGGGKNEGDHRRRRGGVGLRRLHRQPLFGHRGRPPHRRNRRQFHQGLRLVRQRKRLCLPDEGPGPLRGTSFLRRLT